LALALNWRPDQCLDAALALKQYNSPMDWYAYFIGKDMFKTQSQVTLIIILLGSILAPVNSLLAASSNANNKCSNVYSSIFRSQPQAKPKGFSDDASERADKLIAYLKAGGKLADEATPELNRRESVADSNRPQRDSSFDDLNERTDKLIAYLKAGGTLSNAMALNVEKHEPATFEVEVPYSTRNSLVKGLMTLKWKRQDYKTIKVVGPKAQMGLVNDLEKSLARKLQKGSTIGEILLVTADNMLGHKDWVEDKNRSVLHRWSDADQRTMDLSNLNQNPHEALVIVARDKDGSVIASASSRGNAYSITENTAFDTYESVDGQIRSNSRWRDVAFFEITHSHPSLEYMVTEGEGPHGNGSSFPLSPADLASIGQFADILPKNVILKFSAAHPNGYSTSQFFVGGEIVTEEAVQNFGKIKRGFAVQN
jgi:hypothetical protein